MLKKFIFLISIGLCCNLTTLAQIFDAGVFVGLTASQISGDELAGFHQPGGSAGIQLISEKNKLSFGFGLYINQKGSRATSKNLGTRKQYRLRLNYVEVPFFINYAFQKFKFYLSPSINLLASAKEFDQFGEQPLATPFRRFELAAEAGITYEIAKQLSVRLGYGYSLLPVRKFDGQGISFNDGQYNEWLRTGLVYLLRAK